MNGRQRFLATAVALALAGAAHGQTIDPILNQSSMFGINKDTGRLSRYDFGTSTRTVIGYVRNVETGTVITDLQASGYFTGFQQIHAFWTDPADNHTKVVHIDTETGEARLTGVDLGEGRVRGAVAVLSNTDGKTSWKVFALQRNVEPDYPQAVDGMVNLNPSNSNSNEFVMDTPAGQITRDDLKNVNVEVDENGVYYEGAATFIHVRPKGNGNQNSLILNGEPFLLNNGNVYEFTGNMTVRLFNDHIHNEKAMGHWWLAIDAETATVTENSVTIVSPPEPWVPTSKLVTLHTETGLATTVMELSQQYRGLASQDGNTFYAMNNDGRKLYRIDLSSMTETLVGDSGSSYKFRELEFIGSTLMGADDIGDKLVPLSLTTGTPSASGASLGLKEVGTMVFLPTSEIPAKTKLAFD